MDSKMLSENENGAAATLEATPAVLLSIHRGGSGYIAFQRKEGGSMNNLFSLPVKDLAQCFPEHVSWLMNDAYFSVNTMYTQGYGRSKYGFDNARVKLRGEDRLSFLNACYVDLDVGRLDSPDPAARLTWRDAAAAAGKLMDAGILPQASIIARSGRGVYLLWLVCDRENRTIPQRAWPELVGVYKCINKALDERCKHLACDMGAFDAARVLRLPGSYHTKAGVQVRYLMQADTRGQGFVYTLDELADALRIQRLQPQPNAIQERIEYTATPRTHRKVKNPGSAPNRVRGRVSVNAARARDLVKLQYHLGGFAHGHRGRTLHTYAQILRGADFSPGDIHSALAAVAANCRPPYPSEENDVALSKIVDTVMRESRRFYFNATILPALGITAEIARQLELETLVPDEVKAERRAAKRAQPKPRDVNRERLIQFIRDSGPNYPSAGAMAEMAAEAGIATNRETVRQLFQRLGVKSRCKAGRPPKLVRAAKISIERKASKRPPAP